MMYGIYTHMAQLQEDHLRNIIVKSHSLELCAGHHLCSHVVYEAVVPKKQVYPFPTTQKEPKPLAQLWFHLFLRHFD